jgi:Leucine-rich repeat (LRR) protein
MNYYLSLVLFLLGGVGCTSSPKKAPLKEWRLENLAQTQTLELKANQEYQAWPTNILNASKLIEVKGMHSNNLKTLPPWIGKLNQIRFWYLSYTGLQSLPSEIGKLDSTVWLYLEGNQLKTLPSEIGQLKKLKRLKVAKNQLTILPNAIGNLVTLNELDLLENRLKSLPSEIGKLSTLEILNVSDNQLTSLPISMSNMHKLDDLRLRNNRIQSISPNCLPKFLHTLDMSHNKIKEFPLSIYNSQKTLKQLLLQHNNISKIKISFPHFIRLQTLNLGHNQLTEIPVILNKSPLAYLLLNNNKLTDLPLGLSDLKSIRSLDLSNNRFTKIPACVFKLKNLISLDLSNNPLNISTDEEVALRKALPDTKIKL